MKAAELRIGNFVQYKRSDGKILTVGVGSICQSGINLEVNYEHSFIECAISNDMIEGIPLAEQWFLRFGFEKGESGYYKKLKNLYGDYIFTFTLLLIEGDFFYSVPGLPPLPIQYVHQMQNLYYTNTREEPVLQSEFSGVFIEIDKSAYKQEIDPVEMKRIWEQPSIAQPDQL